MSPETQVIRDILDRSKRCMSKALNPNATDAERQVWATLAVHATLDAILITMLAQGTEK